MSNEQLEKEYQLIMSNNMPNSEISADSALIKEKAKAKAKLKKEIEVDNDNTFTKPIITYILKRCEEDEGLCQDIMQEHKTWKKCFDYIYKKARSQSGRNERFVHIPDEVVYEWAEDYYHKDDKEEEEKKAEETAKRKAKQEKEADNRKAKAKNNIVKTVKKDDMTKEQQKPKKSGNDMEGQIDMFSIM